MNGRIVLTVCALLSVLACTQLAGAGISGTVTDTTGQPVSGAVITFSNATEIFSALTGADGLYSVADVNDPNGALGMRVAIGGEDIVPIEKDLIATSNMDELDFVVARDGSGFHLTILHTNDVHSHLVPFNIYKVGDFAGSAGVAEMANVIRNQRDNVIYLDAGDQFVGSPLFSLFEGECEYTVLNAMGLAAFVPGNHEFDYGPERLSTFIDGLNCPVVCANLNTENEPLLSEKVVPHTILEVDERQVGVVGFITQETSWISKPGDTVTFDDIVPAVQAAVDELTALGVNVIIGLSHSSYGTDQMVAASVSELDVIVGGHSHSYLSNTDPNNAEGPYPTVVASPDGNDVLIVQARDWNRYLGNLHVSFDEAGRVVSWSGDPILIDSTVPRNAEIANYLDAKQAEAEVLFGVVIGETLINLDNANIRSAECPLGNLVADAFLWEMQGEGYQIAFTNGGGIRAPIAPGDITIKDVMTVLPFDNYLSTLRLTGESLKKVLENGLTRINYPEDGPSGTGRFLQVAGLRFTFDRMREKGDRVLSIEVKNPDGIFSPVDPAQEYKVVTNDFIRNGGDEFSVLQEEAIEPYDFGRKLSDILADYIIEHSPIAPEVDGRIIDVTPAE